MKDNRKLIDADGVAVILINQGRILVLKRRRFPFSLNPGVYTILYGGKDKKESHRATAYREIEEETKIKRNMIKEVHKPIKTLIFEVKKNLKWYNHMFFFCSKTDKVKLDIENTQYRWATLNEIINRKKYTNLFVEEAKILRIIKSAMNEC